MRHGVLPADAARRRADPARGLGRRRGAAADRAGRLAARPGVRAAPGVSSFGISGTNAHVILEQAPDRLTNPGDGEPQSDAPVPWPLSARDPAGAPRTGRGAGQGGCRPTRGCRPATSAGRWSRPGRAFEHRAVVLGSDPRRVARGPGGARGRRRRVRTSCTGLAVDGRGRAGVRVPRPGRRSGPGWARSCWTSAPVFAERIAECERALAPYVDWSLLRGAAAATGRMLDRRRRGAAGAVRRDGRAGRAVARRTACGPRRWPGTRQGEIAAACVAGALRWTTAPGSSRCAAARCGRSPVGGAMASVGASEAGVAELIARLGAAGLVGRRGERAGVGRGVRDRRSRWRRPSAACRGGRRPGTDDRRRLRLALAAGRPDHRRTPRGPGGNPADAVEDGVPFYSTVTGTRADTDRARHRVLGAATCASAYGSPTRWTRCSPMGIACSSSVSPHPVLTNGMQECFDAGRDRRPPRSPTLRRDHGGRDQSSTRSRGRARAGLPVDWTPVFAGGRGGSSCRRTRSSTRTSGCRFGPRWPMRAGWVWRWRVTRCWVPRWRCRRTVGWC